MIGYPQFEVTVMLWQQNILKRIKWWTLIAPLADERRMWVYSKEKKRLEREQKGILI